MLVAMTEACAEHGAAEVTVARVVQRAAVSRRTFYEIFEDREECLLAAVDHAVAGLEESLRAASAAERSWSARMRAALAALLLELQSEPGLARLCIVETLKAGPVVLERRRQLLDVLVAAVDEGRGESKRSLLLPPLTAEGVVGGALAVLHARLLEDSGRPLLELLNPLMAMIVHPYLGQAAALRELSSAVSAVDPVGRAGVADPFKGLPIRFTYRTTRVLATIASTPSASNREVAEAAGIADEGQMSRLLRRLEKCELIENRGEGRVKGEPNAWRLTERGAAVHHTLDVRRA
jgi:AcrR family transcriptional regulator